MVIEAENTIVGKLIEIVNKKKVWMDRADLNVVIELMDTLYSNEGLTLLQSETLKKLREKYDK